MYNQHSLPLFKGIQIQMKGADNGNGNANANTYNDYPAGLDRTSLSEWLISGEEPRRTPENTSGATVGQPRQNVAFFEDQTLVSTVQKISSIIETALAILDDDDAIFELDEEESRR